MGSQSPSPSTQTLDKWGGGLAQRAARALGPALAVASPVPVIQSRVPTPATRVHTHARTLTHTHTLTAPTLAPRRPRPGPAPAPAGGPSGARGPRTQRARLAGGGGSDSGHI